MSSQEPPALLLDEMFAPALAETLRAEGFDVLAVAGHPVLAAASDDEVLRWAAGYGYRLVTENVRDFEPLIKQAQEGPAAAALFTSSRRFPRSRRNPAPLLAALRTWLADEQAHESPVSWLR